jgi:hypothetical protein
MPTSTRLRTLLLNALGYPELVDELIAAIDAAASIEASEIADGAVTTDKIEDLAVTTGKLALLAVDSGQIAANAVTDAKLRQGAALTVIGRSANSTGNVADIAAGSDAHVLRRSGTTLGFGTLASGAYGAGTVNNAAMDSNILKYVDVTVPTAEVLTLNATPKELVPAPGAGFVNIVDSVYATIDFNSAAYATDAAGFTVRYTNGAGASVGATLTQGFAQAAADARQSVRAAATALTPVANAAVVLYADNADPTTGDSDVKVRVYYRVVPDLL